MRWRYGALWVRVHPGVVCCGCEPWIKLSWFRLSPDIYLIVPGHTWQLWPPQPVLLHARRAPKRED